jgi:multimeric flavodoxin WrbA
MNIVCLYGSPKRKGNSATMAKTFCETATSLGASVREFHLNKLDIKGCQACYGCKRKSERCVLKDDMIEILEAVRACDLLVMASPVYYGDVSAQLKMFIDRTFSYLTPDYTAAEKVSRLSPGKKLVFVLAQGNPDENSFADIYPKYAQFFNWMGFEKSGLIRACGVMEPGAVSDRADIMAAAASMAREMLTDA